MAVVSTVAISATVAAVIYILIAKACGATGDEKPWRAFDTARSSLGVLAGVTKVYDSTPLWSSTIRPLGPAIATTPAPTGVVLILASAGASQGVDAHFPKAVRSARVVQYPFVCHKEAHKRMRGQTQSHGVNSITNN